MLVLSRKLGEKIQIGSDVTVTVLRIKRDKIRLGIEAPRGVSVDREEVRKRRCPHLSESGVDDTPSDTPGKRWQCDECGAEGPVDLSECPPLDLSIQPEEVQEERA